jgi:hypothetical protein
VSRKEVRSATTPLVDVLVLCTALEASPESAAAPSRAAASNRRFLAAPPLPCYNRRPCLPRVLVRFALMPSASPAVRQKP